MFLSIHAALSGSVRDPLFFPVKLYAQIDRGINCHKPGNHRRDRPDPGQVVRPVGIHQMDYGDTQGQRSEAAAYHGKYGLRSAVKIPVHTEHKAHSQIIIAACPEKRDAGFDNSRI